MRIAAITNSRIPSSTANSIQAMKMCSALVGLGHDLTLFAPAEEHPATWVQLRSIYGLDDRFAVNWLGSRRFLRRLDFVVATHIAVRAMRPDLIYTWLPQSAALESAHGACVVLEMHADVAGLMGAWWLRRYLKSGARKRMLVTTKALWSALERSTSITFKSEVVQIAPNAVDLTRYKDLPAPAVARNILGLKQGPTIGFTGHLYEGRGLELLFDLAASMQDVRFLIVGGRPEVVAQWRAKVVQRDLSNMMLVGYVPHARIPMYQAAADVLVMPYSTHVSASSGQDIAEVINPMKLFEYLAAGRPIVSADLPSIHEILDDRSAVFCVPGDTTAWKLALSKLLGDPNRMAALAAKAAGIASKYTWPERARRAVEGLVAA